MMRITGLLLVMCASVGCKSADGKPARAPEPAAPTIESVRAEACGCADEACAVRMLVELEAQRRAFEATYAEATSCVQKLKPPSDGAEEVLQKLGAFRDTTCACQDAACVSAAEKQFMEWAIANMETLKDIKPTTEQEARAEVLEAEMDRCKARHEPSAP
jgi:hypothetical protein